jgi:hypothetical protein
MRKAFYFIVNLKHCSVLYKMTGDRSRDSTGVTTIVEDGTCNKAEGIKEEETDVDTIIVGVRERDKEEGIIDDDSLEGLSLIMLRLEKCMRKQLRRW